MRTYHTPLDLVRSRPLDNPVVCSRPENAARASRWFQDRFPGEILYAVKANPSDWAIDALYASGLRFFDVASPAEIELIAHRCPDARLAYLHPVKSRAAIAQAYHEFGVRVFALDSEAELAKIVEETGGARDLTLIVRLAVSNDGAAFSLAGKFGVPAYDAPDLIRQTRHRAARLGISFHVGSQCMKPSAYRLAMQEASRLIGLAGVTADVVDVGGGFPCIYPGMMPPPMAQYVDAIEDAFCDMSVLRDAELWCEPGRALVAETASVLTRVDLRKGDALYLNDGSYGCLFDAAHARWPFPVRLHRPGDTTGGGSGNETASFRFFGPTCDSLDSMPGPYELPADVQEGDFIEIGMLGAYGMALATQFNGFGRYDTIHVADNPWPTLFEPDDQTDLDPGADIIPIERVRRRPRLRRRG